MASPGGSVSVPHGLNLPTGTNSQYVQMTYHPQTPDQKAYLPRVDNASDPNTWTVSFAHDILATIVTGWLVLTRIPPTWWTTRASDSTAVYLRASESFTATVIVEE